VSLALNLAYLQAYGRIQHYNVDKALLIGGASLPRFGGGQLLTPMRLILSGRASPLPGVGLAELVRAAGSGRWFVVPAQAGRPPSPRR
jgi:S-adenosylmethionine synthetase